MQRVSLANIRPGMVPAYNIFSSDGVVLVRAGLALTEQFVMRLQNLGIGSIYITNELFGTISIPELVKEDIRVNAVKTIKTIFTNFGKTQMLEFDTVHALANSLAENVILNSGAMINTIDTRTFQDYLYGHSVNVCIMSVLTGLMLGYNTPKLRDIAVGSLLHDIGLMLVPADLLNKPGKLTPEEMNIVRNHTERGFQILRKFRELSVPTAHIAYQHHENYDGSGYPRGLKGSEIHDYARIVAITNMYDALISDRPFRKAFLPHEAYELLMTLTNKCFDNTVLDIFLANVAIYPIGSVVQLNTGELAIVTKVFPRLQSRPTVRLITDNNNRLINSASEIDLTKSLTIFINKMLNEQEIIELCYKLQYTS